MPHHQPPKYDDIINNEERTHALADVIQQFLNNHKTSSASDTLETKLHKIHNFLNSHPSLNIKQDPTFRVYLNQIAEETFKCKDLFAARLFIELLTHHKITLTYSNTSSISSICKQFFSPELSGSITALAQLYSHCQDSALKDALVSLIKATTNKCNASQSYKFFISLHEVMALNASPIASSSNAKLPYPKQSLNTDMLVALLQSFEPELSTTSAAFLTLIQKLHQQNLLPQAAFLPLSNMILTCIQKTGSSEPLCEALQHRLLVVHGKKPIQAPAVDIDSSSDSDDTETASTRRSYASLFSSKRGYQPIPKKYKTTLRTIPPQASSSTISPDLISDFTNPGELAAIAQATETDSITNFQQNITVIRNCLEAILNDPNAPQLPQLIRLCVMPAVIESSPRLTPENQIKVNIIRRLLTANTVNSMWLYQDLYKTVVKQHCNDDIKRLVNERIKDLVMQRKQLISDDPTISSNYVSRSRALLATLFAGLSLFIVSEMATLSTLGISMGLIFLCFNCCCALPSWMNPDEPAPQGMLIASQVIASLCCCISFFASSSEDEVYRNRNRREFEEFSTINSAIRQLLNGGADCPEAGVGLFKHIDEESWPALYKAVKALKDNTNNDQVELDTAELELDGEITPLLQ